MYILGNLSKDVFERRKLTESEALPLFIRLDCNKFVLLSSFSLINTIYPRVSTKPLTNDATCLLPVHVRRSKMPLLKLPIITYSPPAKLIKSCAINMSSRVHRRNSCYKVATSIYHQVFINTKNDIKLRYVYIITCSSTVISYPYLMSTKWKAISGQIRFLHVIASKECERRSKSAYVTKFSKWQPCFDVIYNEFEAFCNKMSLYEQFQYVQER